MTQTIILNNVLPPNRNINVNVTLKLIFLLEGKTLFTNINNPFGHRVAIWQQ